MKDEFLKAMDFRHACKMFDEDKKISDENFKFILEVGRKSPSSFGMEPWKFLVIKDEAMKAKIRPYCWNQPQITTCSNLVVILAKIEDLKPQSGVPAKKFSRRKMPQEMQDKYIEVYTNHLKETLSSDENIFSWTARQCYIALANMMTAAASIGIDSCPIEGLEKENIEKVLNLDISKYQLAVIVSFGYRVNEQSKQLRADFDEVVEVI